MLKMQKTLVIYILIFMIIYQSDCRFNLNKILDKYGQVLKDIKEHKDEMEVNHKSLKFSFSNCGPSSDPMKVNSLAFEPDPLVLPGNISLSLDGFLEKDLNSPLTVNFFFLKIVKILKILNSKDDPKNNKNSWTF